MESRRSAACTHPLHFCDRWKPDGLCGQEGHESFVDRAGLALGYHIYYYSNHSLAAFRHAGKHLLRSVQILPGIFAKNGKENGNREESNRRRGSDYRRESTIII